MRRKDDLNTNDGKKSDKNASSNRREPSKCDPKKTTRKPERNPTFETRAEFEANAAEFERNLELILHSLIHMGHMKESEYDKVREEVLVRATRNCTKIPSGRGQKAWIRTLAWHAISSQRQKKRVAEVSLDGSPKINRTAAQKPTQESRFGSSFIMDMDAVNFRLRRIRREYLKVLDYELQGKTLEDTAGYLRKSCRQISNYRKDIRKIIRREFPEMEDYRRHR